MFSNVGISLVDETKPEVESLDQQQQQLTEGIRFAYTVPSSEASQTQQVRLASIACGEHFTEALLAYSVNNALHRRRLGRWRM